MIEHDINYEQWDKIFAKRKEYEKINPISKTSKRYASYKNEKGKKCCSKCGRGDEIGTCSDCLAEKEFLHSA